MERRDGWRWEEKAERGTDVSFGVKGKSEDLIFLLKTDSDTLKSGFYRNFHIVGFKSLQLKPTCHCKTLESLSTAKSSNMGQLF